MDKLVCVNDIWEAENMFEIEILAIEQTVHELFGDLFF